MKKLFIIPIAFSVFLFACSNENKHSHDHSGEDHQHSDEHQHSDSHDHKHENYEVKLPEEGGKWQANKETTEGINSMQQKVKDFIDGNSSPEYETLAEELENEFSTIFAKCTMTGEAHEQLHNYLLPVKYMMEGLKSGEEALQEEKVQELRDHLNEYSNYFK